MDMELIHKTKRMYIAWVISGCRELRFCFLFMPPLYHCTRKPSKHYYETISRRLYVTSHHNSTLVIFQRPVCNCKAAIWPLLEPPSVKTKHIAGPFCSNPSAKSSRIHFHSTADSISAMSSSYCRPHLR